MRYIYAKWPHVELVHFTMVPLKLRDLRRGGLHTVSLQLLALMWQYTVCRTV